MKIRTWIREKKLLPLFPLLGLYTRLSRGFVVKDKYLSHVIFRPLARMLPSFSHASYGKLSTGLAMCGLDIVLAGWAGIPLELTMCCRAFVGAYAISGRFC
jgi:hypothetical protein